MARQGSDEQATPAVPGGMAAIPSHAAPRVRTRTAIEPLPGVAGAAVVMASVALGAAVGAVAALMLQAPAGADAALANLLHAMVGVKALIFAAATALALLRLRAPATTASIAGYGAGLGLSAAALVWLWGLSGLLLGSAMFYGGLILAYLTAGRDPLLSAAVKHKRLGDGDNANESNGS